MQISAELKNPGLRYRPVPFWSWNDKLEPQELRNQINLMHEAGLGGYFMHARGGLLTEYMGEEWFECVKASIDEGRKHGMHSWAYDENGWPSGFGDGRVNGLGLSYQQKYLRLKTVKTAEAARTEHTIAFFRVDGVTTELDGCPDTEILHCYYDVNPYYVDTLDAEVTRTFLEKIYQPYQDHLGQNDWQELSGFFTDEPQVSRNGIPWSFIMEAEYAEAYGEKLLPLLPQLFHDCGDFRRTRYRFWRLVTLLFMNNFMKQIYDWCEAHGTRITGHHVLEETYGSQITSNGAIMPQYQYYHIPGMDWLGRHIKPVTAPVQVASVCAQTGKKQVLSETFALCGWNVKFEELKWIYQWQMVHGINLLCQHLESYSLKGIRKRDYPASLFRHQPWWNDYRQFNDYVSRLGVLLCEGEIRTDVLIVHGQSSAWLSFAGEHNKTMDRYFDSFNQLSELLDAAHINYHYGDETMIAMHGA
ncbi:MAG: glycosyl hydrolase, partial [Lentisphaerota bacterium]